jgi:hypothetical protein
MVLRKNDPLSIAQACTITNPEASNVGTDAMYVPNIMNSILARVVVRFILFDQSPNQSLPEPSTPRHILLPRPHLSIGYWSRSLRSSSSASA